MSHWDSYASHLIVCEEAGLTVDLSRLDLPEAFRTEMKPRLDQAFKAMAELERGAIANPDEKRMVGHYWLRDPVAARPRPILRKEIEDTRRAQVTDASRSAIHSGRDRGRARRALHATSCWWSASAARRSAPQLVASPRSARSTIDMIALHFVDNTDPDGIDRVLHQPRGSRLDETLTVVISKSGGTKETRNGMLELHSAPTSAAGLAFSRHAVAVTGHGS